MYLQGEQEQEFDPGEWVSVLTENTQPLKLGDVK